MAKLTKRADGRYCVKYHGKCFYGKTQKEANEKKKEFIELEAQGIKAEISDVTFATYANGWLEVYKADTETKTYNQYATYIQQMIDAFGADMKIRQITSTDVKRAYNALEGKSASHITKWTATCKAVFKAAVQDGAILRNPAEMVRKPKGEEGTHRCLLPWEQKIVRDMAHNHDFGLAAMVMLYAGLRRGEVLYLDVDRDVDFKSMTITVRGAVSFGEGNQPTVTDGKTDNAQRTVPLMPILADALRGHHGLLCTDKEGNVMSQSAFKRKWDSYITACETRLNGYSFGFHGKLKEHKELIHAGLPLPDYKHFDVRCHDFRHSFCTMCYEANIPVKTLQHWMGHADAQMIMKIYAHLSEAKESADALRLADRVSASVADAL